MLLPALIDSTADFMNLPIVYTQYNPLAIIRLLDFCTKDMTANAISDVLKRSGIEDERNFIKI